MSKTSVHYRWFDKTKPPPEWLHLELSDEDLRNLLQFHDRGTTWRLTYFRTIWKAIPPWASKERIKDVYAEAHARRQRGEDVEVDHIIPLHGTLVCGLHVHTNLRVIGRKLNAFLSNKEYPGSPQMRLFENQEACHYFELTGS